MEVRCDSNVGFAGLLHDPDEEVRKQLTASLSSISRVRKLHKRPSRPRLQSTVAIFGIVLVRPSYASFKKRSMRVKENLMGTELNSR